MYNMSCYNNSYYGCNPYYSRYYNSYCQPQNCCQPFSYYPPPCPTPPVCTQVAYIIGAPTPTTIPSNTVGTAPTLIPVGSTTIPAGTVNPIIGYTAVPTTNIGGVTVNTTNGQFTIPAAGRYIITGYFGFSSNAVGSRELYVYKIDGTTGVISLLALDSRNAVTTTGEPTNITITTAWSFNASDRVFFAATQNSGSSLTTTTDSQVSIVRIN